MMPEPHRMARLAEAYIHAEAASAGVICETTRMDYGIDGYLERLRKIRNFRGRTKIHPTGYPLHFQLKASTHWKTIGDTISYAVDADTYNHLALRAADGGIPCVLILYCLPNDREVWTEFDEKGLTLRRCGYYHHIDGAPTTNIRTQTVRIPKSQMVRSERILSLLEWAEGRIGR